MKTHENPHLQEEAAEWVIRRLEDDSGDCSTEFFQWLKQSPRHIDEFLMAAATYATLKRCDVSALLHLDTLLEDEPANVIPLESSTAFGPLARSTVHSSQNPRLRSTRHVTTFMSLAAGLAALTVGIWTLWPYITQTRNYVTGVGEQRAFRLQDGSVLQLNTRSHVAVHFSGKEREVRLLEGEALFEVTRDASRPFRVLTTTAVVQAVGTEFNVYQYDDKTRVSVLEGSVRVTARPTPGSDTQYLERTIPSPFRTADVTNPALLAAGEEAQVAKDGQIVKAAPRDVTNAVGWRQRMQVFRATPLAEVVDQFNRYNEYQMHVESKELGQRLIWGVFHVDQPQALAKFLARDSSVELQSSSDGLLIRARINASAKE